MHDPLLHFSARRILFPLIALCTFSIATAQETGPAYSGSMGSVTVGDQQLYRLSMRPDIPLGKWGLALDIELFIDEEGGFSDRGWEFGTSTETLNTFLRKLYYLRYGRPKDDLYFKIGALDEVTLGYGFIMDGYRNTVQYPGIKKTGVQFQLDNLGSQQFKVEGVVNNIQDFQGGGALVGLRLSARPAGKLEFGLTYVVDIDQYGGLLDSDDDGFPDDVDAFPGDKNRALDNDADGVADETDSDDDNDGAIDIDAASGFSDEILSRLGGINADFGNDAFPVDRDVNRKNPFNKDRVGSDRFGILGFDAAYPLVDSEQLDLRLYGQLALLVDDDDQLSAAQADSQGVTRINRKAEGFGIAAPGLWLKAGPLTGQIEFRHFQDDFDAGYFDNLYELDRTRLDVATGRATPKDALLGRDASQSGVYGRIGANLGGLLDTAADYQYLTGADNPKQQLHARANLSKKMLENVPRLTRAQAYYQKNNIGARLNERGNGEDDFLESTEDTFYGYLVGWEMSSGVSLFWDTRFVFERGADLRLRRQKIMTIETVFTF